MNTLSLILLTIVLSIISVQASAHIGWGEINGIDCSASKCRYSPIELEAGTTIEVTYDVQIVHGAPVTILLKNGEQSIILKEGLPETPGLNSTSVTMPNIECDNCAFNVTAAGYSGLASVSLTAGGTGIVTNAAPVVLLDIFQGDKAVTWVNPSEGTVWVKTTVIDMNMTDTHSYDWTGTDSLLVDETVDDETMISFNPSILVEGNYTIHLVVSDNGDPVLSDTVELSLMVANKTAAAPSKKGGSVDWMFVIFGLACALYCLALYVYGIKRAKSVSS